MESLHLPSPFPGAACFRFAEIPSTMDEARRLARMGFPAGTLVLADSQSAGRGRLPGRRWEAPPGAALLATLALPGEAAALPGLTLRVGLALLRALRRACLGEGRELSAPLLLKWPNDLVAGGRKLGGILCEAAEGRVFAGFGLNLAQEAFPPELAGKATSLRLLGGGAWEGLPARLRILALALEEIALVLREEGWRAEAEALLWRRGEEASFLEGRPEEGRILEGRLEGIDSEGALLLRPPGSSAPLALRSGELLPPRLEPEDWR